MIKPLFDDLTYNTTDILLTACIFPSPEGAQKNTR